MEDTVQPIPAKKRKRVRAYLGFGVAGMLALYFAGLYSRPLLFGTGAVATTEDCAETGAGASASSESAQGPGQEGISVAQAYQLLAQEVRELRSGDYTTPEVEAKVVALEQEVEQLRVLNPYYLFKEIQASVIPTSVPDTYGAELSVSFGQVQSSIDLMRRFDPTYGEDGITLTGTDLERYVRVGSSTACLYCCTATTLVKPNGDAACACAHSQAMRGLAAFLIVNHREEYTDEELVEELNRWRAVYFPRQTLTVALIELRDSGEPGIEQIEQEFPEFMPQMVGGC